MAKGRALSVDDLTLQISALCLLMMMSMDAINPVKALSSFLGIDPYTVGWINLLVLFGVLYNNLSDVLYFCIRIFLNSVLSIFFKSIEIVGKDNIPMDGPVIFTGNHANQFVDGMIVMMNCYRKVGFLIAEKSMHLPVVGDLARVMGCIPVVRPQDAVLKGTGKVCMQPTESGEFLLVGEGTSFLIELARGDQVRYNGKTVIESGKPVKVEKVLDDTHAILTSNLLNSDEEIIVESSAYGIFKKVDQSHTFSEVYTALKRGNCVGIFPEGGSHDRTDLLPLKAGVALMAFGVKETYHISVPIVPVGLNYFRGHRFRGRVVIEFGEPITVSNEDMDEFKQDKRKACNAFLHTVEEGMRSVIVTAPDYTVLQLIYTARRLYQPSGIKLSPKETQDLNRRFAEAYKILNEMPEAQEEMNVLRSKLEEYRKSLSLMGLTDHQVPYIAWWSIHDVISSAVYGVCIFALASIPSFILNAPVGLMARHVARAEQTKALAGSTVKIAARDVVLSKKITFSIIAVPILWITYMLLAMTFTNWKWSSIFLLTACFPLFSYFGVRSVEAGIIELKTLRPLFYRLQPKYRKIQDELPQRRARLQMEVRLFVRKYAPVLGPLADPAPIDWSAYMHSLSKSTESTSTSDENKQQTITKEHDLSFMKREKTPSMINLRSMLSEGAPTSAPTSPTSVDAIDKKNV
ncbi:glycerol-3-phosphate O-acyltransferase [Thraustotheca clavata]|uniref:Glycerol-3-phosphate O-acyltransferase n=1 Tax=Thraustotheca clavata TaxID=74557 RepID=A0A1W0A054_9STRA|nr:glycerol-3-phosphate O-acyltransferase [Thraustotheca clavata]